LNHKDFKFYNWSGDVKLQESGQNEDSLSLLK
jgi:hypothetical protein